MSEKTEQGGISKMNWLGIVLLAFSGGTIYMMPYARSSYYDALMQGLGVTNTELGMITSFFGLLTIICYFPGGWLADRFSAKKLLTVSFLTNAILGFWYSSLPSFSVVIFIHVLFGVFCTLTFWAAFIKATRLCAPPESQGKAFGFVEGIRRIISTGIGLVGAWLLGLAADPVAGVKHVLMFYAAMNAVVGLGILFLMKEYDTTGGAKTGASLGDIVKVAKISEVWLIAIIVFMAYVSFRSQDIMTAYTTNLCGLSGSLGAAVAAIRYYGLGFMAIPGGVIGDKFGFANTMIGGFVIVILTNILFILFPGTPASVGFFIVIMLSFMAAHFGMRGVYYALMTEGMVPVAATGIATGIIATLAYSPDIFAPLYQGALLDAFGKDKHTGYNYIFIISIVTAVMGIGLSMYFKSRVRVKAAAAASASALPQTA
ncbi:MAG: MFS transporter [Deltaproteobacteria bacterium]|jgi:MFS family permease|nr:MFS transporter [Deltaproteobacteria bacterium]